jgi:hypothetical protein
MLERASGSRPADLRRDFPPRAVHNDGRIQMPQITTTSRSRHNRRPRTSQCLASGASSRPHTQERASDPPLNGKRALACLRSSQSRSPDS